MENDLRHGSDEQGKQPPLIAEIAVDGAFVSPEKGLLSYLVPPGAGQHDLPGRLVWVPLRAQIVLGLIVSVSRRGSERALKPLRALVEPAFRLDADQMATAEWLARETACSFFAAASPFFPPGVTHRAVEYLRPIASVTSGRDGLTPAQRRLVALLEEQGETSLAAARKTLGTSLAAVVPKLEGAGVIERVVRVKDTPPAPRVERFVKLVGANALPTGRAPRQRAVVDYLTQRARLAPIDSSGFEPLAEVLARTGTDHATVGALARKGVVEEIARPRGAPAATGPPAPAPTLTRTQATAWQSVERSLAAGDTTPILLHGVTGSGKTEIYLRAVAWCLRRGRSAIVLVPEIALATQVVERFRARFPGEVAVLHSALPDADRYAAWQAVATGQLRVVVGPRSALFAPVERLGLIVIDEEHEGAFKQEGEPRYHARTLAEHLAAREGCVLMLGSATPAVETAWRSTAGQVRRLSLPARVGGRAPGSDAAGSLELPSVEIVDMRLELHRGHTSLLSGPLHDAVRRALQNGEQSILFLNRRGTATIVQCRACGTVVACPHCDIPMVFHRDRGRMVCHRCNHRVAAPRACAACGGGMDYFGAGTQRVEEEVKRVFPSARVLRWDQDSVRRQGGHERMLRRIEGREVDIVVGTQMIAKGLDLPMVTAIGVIHADTMLHLPDFRSGERTFQLLTQVAGRAGRRTAGSRVVIQTYTPDHYAIQAASRHDYAAFFDEELAFRREHRYPPFGRLARFAFRHQAEEVCTAEAEEMARRLARHAREREVKADLLGPTPAFASKVRGKHQWQIVLRADPGEFDRLLDELPVRPGWQVDVDPQSLL